MIGMFKIYITHKCIDKNLVFYILHMHIHIHVRHKLLIVLTKTMHSLVRYCNKSCIFHC